MFKDYVKHLDTEEPIPTYQVEWLPLSLELARMFPAIACHIEDADTLRLGD